MDIIVTLPASIKWEDYQKELDLVSDWSHHLNFSVGKLPKNVNIGDKCYILYKGFIIGWHKIIALESKQFICTTTGKEWCGNFILRSGPLNKINKEIKMKGFQGFRYLKESL